MGEALVRTMHCQSKNAGSILKEAKAGKKQESLDQACGPLIPWLFNSIQNGQATQFRYFNLVRFWCIVMTTLGHHNSSPCGFVLSS